MELKVLEQRVLAEERGSHYTGASLAAEEERSPLLQRRLCTPGCMCVTAFMCVPLPLLTCRYA